MIRRTHQILVATALTCVLAACGSTTGGSSGSGDEVQGVQGKTISIGSSAILSGPQVAYAQIDEALAAYFDNINAKGGVNGYTFKVVRQDNAYTAAQSVAVARSLALQEKVFALSVAGTTPTSAVLPIAEQLKLPITFIANADLVTKTQPNVYGLEPSFSRVALFDADYALTQLGTKKIGYAYSDDPLGQPALDVLPAYVKSKGGTLTTVGFPTTATDYSSYASKLQASGAEAVIVFGGPANMAGLQRAANSIGFKPKWIGLFASVTPSYLDLAGPLAEGTYFDNFLETLGSDTPSVKQFKEVVGAKDPKALSLLGELGWTNGALITEGVRGATNNGGKLSWKSFQDSLSKLTNANVGVWPDVTFTESSHSGAVSSNVLQVKNGTFTPLTDFKPLPEKP
jgi:branched-chain amino acid transport system substrate-binding protein